MSDVYVASSWKNESLDAVVRQLRGAGLSAYDFRDPADNGDSGFHWNDVFPEWDAEDGRMDAPMVSVGLDTPLAARGFAADIAALGASLACLLVLPAGNSAHLELGWAAGRNKVTGVLLPDGLVRPDLMWKAADVVTPHLAEFIALVLARKAQAA